MHHAFLTKHIEHNRLIYIKLINIMIRTNYVMNQFGVKGQRHLWDPRGSAPGGGPARRNHQVVTLTGCCCYQRNQPP